MKCPDCGATMKHGIVKNFETGPTLGLQSVIVTNMPASVCPKSSKHEVLVPGAMLDQLQAELACFLLSESFRLTGDQVRFLRKSVGLTQAELAARLGTSRVSVNRWENSRAERPAAESIAIRGIVSAAQTKPIGWISDRFLQNLLNAPTKRPKQLRIDSKSLGFASR